MESFIKNIDYKQAPIIQGNDSENIKLLDQQMQVLLPPPEEVNLELSDHLLPKQKVGNRPPPLSGNDFGDDAGLPSHMQVQMPNRRSTHHPFKEGDPFKQFLNQSGSKTNEPASNYGLDNNNNTPLIKNSSIIKQGLLGKFGMGKAQKIYIK